jgi:hypothetical protein
MNNKLYYLSDVFDEDDCGDVVVLAKVVEIGMSVGEDGEKISKTSTTSECSLELYPPPKNILFVDDVDTSK